MPLRVHALLLLALLATGVAATGARARGSRFGCVVPSVKRASLKTAESRLRAAHCAAGQLEGPRDGLVSEQRPAAGRHVGFGARVALKLRRPHSAPVVAPADAPPQPPDLPGNWRLTLDADFDGRALNTSLWRTGWFGNGVTAPMNPTQLACYSPSNVTFPGDGTMHLNVTAEPSSCGGLTEPYTGALVTTDPFDGRGRGGFQYTYGIIQARVFIPAAGTQIADWPGVWSDGQSWPADGENDLLEGLAGVACSTFHSPLGATRACDRSLSPGWHTFASDWRPGSITYYYDGVAVGSVTTGVTSGPMFIVLDNTVHSGEAGVTEADSMQIQYVRVWQSQG